ncbi:response regulator transcription factor [Sediminicoccus sp. BL-A-41-H5]|uniref:response regulator transcription factor n=1 Tax=Sediminicoccus sp. BL-A-41-H5 TaxID=3421106 RepID=UPI003D670B52
MRPIEPDASQPDPAAGSLRVDRTARAGQDSFGAAPPARPGPIEICSPRHSSAERILLLDLDAQHLRRLTQYLTGHGYRVIAIQDAGELPLRLHLETPDLILLEQRLGDVTGTEVLGQIRAVSSVPVIILTAQSDPVDRIINLEMGADDQVHKSVPEREIMARMRAVLRRVQPAADRPPIGWAISEIRRDVVRPDGSGCGLTTAEFGVLHELAMAGGAAVSRGKLSQRVFGRPLHPGDRAVDTVICKLRQKLGPGVIVTVRPAGYAFVGFPGAGLG